MIKRILILLRSSLRGSLFFKLFRKKKKLHLRYVLQAAILIEQGGERFYKELAQITIDGKAKELCVRLANDEADHKKIFEDALARWVSLPTDEEHLKSYIKILKDKGLFSDISFSDVSVEDLLWHAIGCENKIADFYQSLEQEFPEFWKQAHIHQLVIIERRHAESLKSLVSKKDKN